MMDWERKFNSLIKDTEANLSRVKNKFNANTTNNVTWAPKSYSTPMKKSSSLLDIPIASTPRFQQNGFSQSFHPDMYNGTTTNSIIPYPSTQSLQERIDQQNVAIDHLTGVVHRLETDRHNYKEQIRDLRNEIYQLTDKASDRRPDPSSERRMEHMRRELLGEIQLLQSQVQISSAKGSNSNLSDTQLLSMNRDVLEIKHAFRDELEGFRRDFEIVRSRIAKVEMELANVLSGRREVERRQDGLDRTLNSLNLAQKPQIPPSAIALMNTNRQLEKLQINELRSTLGALKDKIDILETSTTQPLNGSNGTHVGPVKKPNLYFNGLPSKPVSSGNDVLDELDLSDDDSESSDFTEFETGVAMVPKTKRKSDPDLDTVNSDDLDIDDLDLSDDDLSDNSLDDSLNHEDLT